MRIPPMTTGIYECRHGKAVKDWETTMPAYHFTLRDAAGHNEDLGFIDLRDDKEAIAFGQDVITDILHEGAAPYAESAMDITAGMRFVDALAFDMNTNRQKKYA